MSASPEETSTEDSQAASLSTRLPRQIRGYDRAATETLFAKAAANQAELERDCAALREEIKNLQGALGRQRAQEKLVSQTLLTAQSHATTIKDKARQEAEQLLSKARAEFERRTAQAEQLERERAAAERELTRLRQLVREMQTGLSEFLAEAISELRSDEKREMLADASTAVDDAVVEASEPGSRAVGTSLRFMPPSA